MLLVRTLSYSQEDHRFFSARRVYNRIRKNSANVDGYRRDQAEVRRKDPGGFENVRSKGEISRNTIW